MVTGGDASLKIDGYRGKTILEAKHSGKPDESPYVPGSRCPDFVRDFVLEQARDELRRAREIIESGSTPFKSIEIVTNTPEAKVLFEQILKEMGLPGAVRLAP